MVFKALNSPSQELSIDEERHSESLAAELTSELLETSAGVGRLRQKSFSNICRFETLTNHQVGKNSGFEIESLQILLPQLRFEATEHGDCPNPDR